MTLYPSDISKYFDTIPHANLMAVVAERISDGKRRNVGGGKGNRRGTPQGGVISPLLANLYLHLMDRIWERHQLAKKLGARLVRYADDFVVLCRRGTERPMAIIRQILSKLSLTLNETKSRILDASKEHFDFLGFELQMRKNEKTGKSYPHVQPSKKSQKKIRERLTKLTERRMTPVPMEVIIKEINQALRGWVGYFHYRNCSSVLKRIREHSQHRLRIHLMKRHGIRRKVTGYGRIKSRTLYERYGLYKVPTTAVWR